MAGSTTIGGMGINLGLNYAGFNAGMVVVGSGVKDLIGQIGGLTKAGLALAGITSIAKTLGKAFDGFTKVEENRITFEALTGSAYKAKKLMGEISEVAYKSTFASEFSGAAKELLKFGFEADSIAPTLSMLSDVASGTGSSIGELAQLVGMSGYRAAISKRQLAGLAESGVPILQQLGKSMNLSKESILELADQKGIKFDDLMGALRAITAEGGQYHDMTQKRGMTTLGIWHRIEEGIGGAISKFGSVFGDSAESGLHFKEGLAGIADVVESIRTGVISLQPAIDLVILSFQAVADVGATVWDGISAVLTTAEAVWLNVFDTVGVGLGTFRSIFIEAMLSVRFVFQNFGDFAELIFERFKLGLALMVNDAWHLFTVNLPEMLGWFSRNWRGVFTDLYEMTITIFTNIGKNIWDFFTNIPGLIAGTVEFKDIWTPLTQGFESAIKETLVFTKREFTDFEKGQIARVGELNNALAAKKEKFFGEEMAKLDRTMLPQVDMGYVTLPDEKKSLGELAKKDDTKEGRKYASAFEYGSKEAYNLVLKSREFDNAPATRTAKATEKAAANSDKIVDYSKQIADSLVDLPDLSVGEIG